MKKMLLSLTIMLSAFAAQAAVDNAVEVNLHSTVGRQCEIDLGGPSAPLASVSKTASIQKGLRDAFANDTITQTVYETCNEDYQINIKSEKGALESENGARLNYMVSYGADFTDKPSTELASPLAMVRLVDQSVAATPMFEQHILQLDFIKQPDLAKGHYQDKITMEMATKD